MSDTFTEFVYNGQRYRISKVEAPKWVYASKLDETGKAGRGRPSKLPYDEVVKVVKLVPESVSEDSVEHPAPTENSFPEDEKPVVKEPETEKPVNEEGFVILD